MRMILEKFEKKFKIKLPYLSREIIRTANEYKKI